jgi:hypothetical protein
MSELEVTSGLGELRDRVGRLEKGLEDNTAATARVEENTAEMIDLFRSAKGGFRVLAGIGSVLKWATAVAASVLAIWFSLKGGK